MPDCYEYRMWINRFKKCQECIKNVFSLNFDLLTQISLGSLIVNI
jgi:hypothetical protein